MQRHPLGQREFHGDEVMVLRDLSMGFEDRTLFSDVKSSGCRAANELHFWATTERENPPSLSS